ncbi:MAG: LysE family translocator [Sneathiella sp.]|nr:LysE family translocator [Sneathiella sp.]
MTFEFWLGFVGIWLLATLPLGPNAAFTISSTISQGRSKALCVPFGIGLASIVHALSASLGVGSLLLAFPALFGILKIAGAIYLIWLGIKFWRKKSVVSMEGEKTKSISGPRLITQGFLVSLSNPKAILSYMVLFLAYIDITASVWTQLLILIPTSTAIVLCVYFGYALLSLPLKNWMSTTSRQRALNRTTGSFFMIAGLGIMVRALSRN